MPTRLTLRIELLAMRDEGSAVRDKLLQAGELGDGCHPEMEAVHERHTARMREILAQYDWPTRQLVGVDGEEAAWLIVQHAIGDPELQRQALPLLEQAATAGEAPSWQAAYLCDLIAYFEGRPQRYGTQLDTGADGYIDVYQLEDPAGVDQLRTAVGLGPLERPARDGQTPRPVEEVAAHRANFAAWVQAVGWRRQ